MNSECLASIIVLTYNQEEYLSETIESLLNQKCSFKYEIVIGEDGSSDRTREIAQGYVDRNPDVVRLMPKEANKGVIKNIRDAVRACRGKYVAYCSGDDYWHNPNKLEKQVAFFEANPEYGLVHTDANYFFESRGIVIEDYNRKNQPGITEGKVFEALLRGDFYISSLTVCARKELIDRYIDYDRFISAGISHEDYPTWLELSQHTLVKYLDESTSTYRIIGNSISRPVNPARKFAYFESIYKIKDYFIDRYQVGKEITDDIRVSYHKEKFDLAFKWQDYEKALPSYQFLKEHQELGLKRRVKKALLKFSFLYRIANYFKGIIKPKTATLDLS